MDGIPIRHPIGSDYYLSDANYKSRCQRSYVEGVSKQGYWIDDEVLTTLAIVFNLKITIRGMMIQPGSLDEFPSFKVNVPDFAAIQQPIAITYVKFGSDEPMHIDQIENESKGNHYLGDHRQC